jgi:predicted amino acid dehydrogenase
VVGDGGVTIAQRLNMPVTTGNSLTVGFAVEALIQTAERHGLEMERATAAVVGASGSIGLASAEMLAPLVERLILIGRREIRLSQARAQAEAAGAARVRVSTDLDDVATADLILSATSATRPILRPHHLKKTAVVCDVARPPDVAPAVKRKRGDVAVVEGGIVSVPGSVNFGFDLGLPAGQAYACMAEAMTLALEGRYESFSLGQRVHTEKAQEITQLARKHGFRSSAGMRPESTAITRQRTRPEVEWR